MQGGNVTRAICCYDLGKTLSGRGFGAREGDCYRKSLKMNSVI